MSDDVGRDERIAAALEAIPVPGYEPGFWDRLDARLAAEPFPGLAIRSLEDPPPTVDQPPVLVPVPAPVAPEPLPAVEPAATAARRRGFALLGAAAAVVLAVLALQLGDPGEGDPQDVAAEAGDVLRRAQPGPGGPTGSGPAVQGVDGPSVTPLTTDTGSVDGGGPRSGTAQHGGTGTTKVGAEGGAAATAASLGPPGAKDTPQDAFVTWAAALDGGDLEAALALTGPRTRRAQEAAGTPDEALADRWAAAYGSWSEPGTGRIEVLEASPSAGDRVVVLLLDRPADGSAGGQGPAMVPVVEGSSGWLVEPDARHAETLSSSEPAHDGGAPPTVAPDHVIEVPAARSGTYTLALDRRVTTEVPATKAVDGVIRWDPPDAAMTPGRHAVVVVHVTDDTITTSTILFEVVKP